MNTLKDLEVRREGSSLSWQDPNSRDEVYGGKIYHIQDLEYYIVDVLVPFAR